MSDDLILQRTLNMEKVHESFTLGQSLPLYCKQHNPAVSGLGGSAASSDA